MSRWCNPFSHVSGGFWLLAAWFALSNGWRLLFTILSAAALHELGHYLALRSFGTRVTGLRINILGAQMRTESRRLSYGQELLAVLAGPAANLLWALLLAPFSGTDWVVGVHLSLCFFNLLPIRPLDGGRAFYLLVSWASNPSVGDFAARCVGGCTALSLSMAVAWVIWRSGGSLWLAPAAVGLLCAGIRELAPGKSGRAWIL